MKKWVIIVLSVFALWFGGWFAAAHWADGKVEEALQSAQENGLTIECPERSMIGFPFRLGLRCESIRLSRIDDPATVAAEELKTAANLHAPGEIILDLTGPLTVEEVPVPVTLDWSSLRGFLDARFSGGFDLVSLKADELTAEAGATSLSASNAIFHMRPQPADGKDEADLDLALDAADVSAVIPGDITVPAATLSADATLIDGYRDIILDGKSLPDWIRQGAALDLRKLMLSVPDGGKFILSGPLELDRDGFLSGTIKVGLANPDALGNWAGRIDPQLTGTIAPLAQAVSAMGKDTNIGADAIKTVDLTIDKGDVRMGFVSLVQIPPLHLGANR